MDPFLEKGCNLHILNFVIIPMRILAPEFSQGHYLSGMILLELPVLGPMDLSSRFGRATVRRYGARSSVL
jgi:hypothetical protein